MKIEFQNSNQDFNDFLKCYYFKKEFYKRLLIVIVLSLLFATSKGTIQLYNIVIPHSNLITVFIVLLSVFFLIPYIISRLKYQKAFKNNSLNEFQTIILKEDGVDVVTKSENLFWRWETLNKTDIVDKYLFFTLFTNKIYIIPLKYFISNNEAINFLGILKNNISKVKGQSIERKSNNLYYWGLVGFIPNFGVIAGMVLIIKGFEYGNKKLVLIGSADILFTVVFWTIIFPYLTPTQ